MTYTTGARRHDLLNRFSKTEMVAMKNWKLGDDVLTLRKNNTFKYCIQPMGITAEYFTGNYEKRNDTLVFTFVKNNQLQTNRAGDTLNIEYHRDLKPAVFGKNNKLVIHRTTEYGKEKTVLKNENGDRLYVVNTKPRNNNR